MEERLDDAINVLQRHAEGPGMPGMPGMPGLGGTIISGAPPAHSAASSLGSNVGYGGPSHYES